MSTIDHDERESRRSALDAFAQAAPREDNGLQVMPMSSGGVDRMFGAQKVAIYRDEQRVLQKLAALGAAAGDDWYYRFPVRKKIKNKETGKDEWVQDFIEGPSIKLANDLARIYGNCEIDTRVIDLGPSWLIYARFIDYESGYALTRPFQQNKGGSKMGGTDDARRLDIAFQIGVSKAVRNVVVNSLQTFADYAFDQAKNSLVEKIGKDLAKWRERIAASLANIGVDVSRAEAVLGRARKDWLAPDIAKIIAMGKAIADGMATADDCFPPKGEHIDPATGEVTSGPANAAGEAGKGQAASADEAANSSAKKSAEEVSTTAQSSEAGTHAGGKASASPATSTEADAGSKTADKAKPVETVDKSKPSTAEKDKPADSPRAPANEREYIEHAQGWIEALVDADAGDKQWSGEKTMRNKCNVSSESREALQERLAEKQREIRDADKS